MRPALKLLTGVAATCILARGAVMWQGQAMMSDLAGACATALAAHGVTDGSVNFRGPSGLVGRVASVSGSADPATRAAIIAEVRRHPGIADARWVAR